MNRRLLAAAAITCGAALVATPASATADATGTRLAGENRFTTAQAIMTDTFGDGANVAFLVSGRSFPDALAATYLAGASGSPILLTESDRLSDGILETLDSLGISGVFVVGGEAAVSSDVVSELQDAGYVTDRVAGENRYGTARAIAELAGTDPIGDFGAGRAAIVVTGQSSADALAAGPISAAQGLPVLLTPSDQLGPDAENALLDLQIEQVLLVGGTSAVSEAIAGRIDSLGITVRRVAGADRMATSVRLADLAVSELQFPADRVLLARGDSPADALVGGIRGGRMLAPILLVESSTNLGGSAGTWINENRATITTVEALGGTGAISDAVLDFAVAAAKS